MVNESISFPVSSTMWIRASTFCPTKLGVTRRGRGSCGTFAADDAEDLQRVAGAPIWKSSAAA